MFWHKGNKTNKKEINFNTVCYCNQGEHIYYVQMGNDVTNEIKVIIQNQNSQFWDYMIRKVINKNFKISEPNDIVNAISYCIEKDESRTIEIGIKSAYSYLIHSYPIKLCYKVEPHKIYLMK